MSIQKTLKEVGLSDKEVAVYLALFRGGKMTPSELAKRTKINRATVYVVVQSLMSRGIIVEDSSEKKQVFSALSADNLRQIIEIQRRDLEEKEGRVEKAINELNAIVSEKSYPVPKIRFVEEGEVESFLYANMDKWAESSKKIDGILWGFRDETFLKTYEKFIRWYWGQPKNKDFKMYQVGNNLNAEKEFSYKMRYPGRKFRLSADLQFTSSVWVGGDFLVMAVTQQHPYYLVEIHDETLAHNMREIFKKLWKESGENTKKIYEKYPT